ncbi:MAG: metal-dependent hydrolase [Nitrospirota bacterium]|jgi:inner membrane protein
MPSPIGHTLASWLLASIAGRKIHSKNEPVFWIAALIAGNLPDLDLLPAVVVGLEAVSPFHQGITHSIGFAATAGLAFGFFFRKRGIPLSLGWPFFAALTYAHVLLDSLGDDTFPPIGVMLLWPFSSERFLSPVSLFPGVKKGSLADLWDPHNLVEFGLEAGIFLPLIGAVWLWKSGRLKGVSRAKLGGWV